MNTGNKNLLILRNNSSLAITEEFFFNNSIDIYSSIISRSCAIDNTIDCIGDNIILLTSKNAISYVNDNIERFTSSKIYCLNNSLYGLLNAKIDTELSWNNTKELADYLIKNEDKSKKVIHLCSDNANKMFYPVLKNAGFKIRSENVYKTSFVSNLNKDVVDNLKDNNIKYIMIFSKMSLNHLNKIMLKNNINIKDYKLLCFSKNIANGFSDYYAKESTLSCMLELYKSLIKEDM